MSYQKTPGLHVQAIAGMDEERGIGKSGSVPWHIPKDWEQVERLANGKPLIIGRRTWDSMDGESPGKFNIVVTHEKSYQSPGAVVVPSVEAGLTEAAKHDTTAIIYGGAGIYAAAMPFTDEIKLTRISGTHECDTFFPEFEDQFHEVRASEPIQDAGHTIQFVDYERNQ